MRRSLALAFGFCCGLALILACFGPVLFRGQQFGYRDAGHYYYPLYERVQQEWSQGHLPLWDARENAGMPLLGNPTAAVLYPGKVIYALLPYPWAARVYPVAHVILACVGMYLLMRGWQVGAWGSLLAALSYGFGAPILFQYCNIIFLVGAAWVPFGLSAADRWIRTGNRSSIVVLGLVLAMQVLGGDPETAYVLGLCAGGYAIGLSFYRWRERRNGTPVRVRTLILAGLCIAVLWVAGTAASAFYFPGTRAKGPPVGPISWTPYWPMVLNGAWGLLAIVWLARRSSRSGPLVAMLAGLAASAVLGGAITAAQLLPVMEFTGKTMRATLDGPHDIYPFSVEPYRAAEFVWPEVFGANRESNRSWGVLIPPKHKTQEWVPSLYVGGLTLVLALSAFGLRGMGARRVWLSWIAGVSLLAALGPYAGPLWYARCVPAIANLIGAHDTFDTAAIRGDTMLRDGDGSVYNLMTLTLPGFASFRYPSKLLTFTCVAIAGLAGIGLDRALSGRSRRPLWIALGLSVVSVCVLGFVVLNQGGIIGWFRARASLKGSSVFGPFDAVGAWRDLRISVLHGTLAMGSGVVVLSLARRKPSVCAVGAILLTTIDLIFASAPLVMTVPQSAFEGIPELVQKIAEAEARDPSPGPFRVHRMGYWDPVGFFETTSPNRHREMMEWERKTIQPKYAIPHGLSYTLTEGVAEHYDYSWFFAPFRLDRNVQSGKRSDANVEMVTYYPRKAFDIWATRYFIVPSVTANDQQRAIYSFLYDVEAIAPRPDDLEGTAGRAFLKKWEKEQDWRLLKNKNAFPRSWIVHGVEIVDPIEGSTRQSREARQSVMEKLLFPNDIYWNNPTRKVMDLKSTAFVESLDHRTLFYSLSFRPTDPTEKAEIVSDDDTKVVIEADLTSPGLVILADLYYPGWELYVDGKLETILQTNRMMRGVAVAAGHHRIVYVYNPRSARLGMAISGAGLILALGAFLWCRSHPRSPRLDLL